MIKENKNNVARTNVITDPKSEEIIGTFYKKALQKTNQKEFRTEKLIKRKGNKPYVKWKEYNNSCNSGINKKTEYKCVNIFQNLNPQEEE